MNLWKASILFGVFLTPAFSQAASGEIEKDEFVLVQDRYAALNAGKIGFPFEAIVFEEGFEIVQKAIMRAVCEYAKIDCDRLSKAERETFMKRTRLGVVDHESGRKLKLVVSPVSGSGAETSLKSKASGSDGWIRQSFALPSMAGVRVQELPWAITNLAGRPPQTHRSPVIDTESSGLSIICDIDDTVRETHVLDHGKMMRTIFFEPFKVVDPILDRIRNLRKSADGSFVPLHFVSAGPEPLVEGISEGLKAAGLDDFEIFLRPFRFKDSSSLEYFKADPYLYKVKSIRKLFDRYPKRRFVLMGDSGEKDPEVYREILRLYPTRVEKIVIRRIQGADNQPARFQGLPVEFEDETISADASCEKKII